MQEIDNDVNMLYLPVEKIKLGIVFRVLEGIDIGRLASSIRDFGVIEPIIVRPIRDHYEVVAGALRYLAAKEVGLESIPCIVRELSDKESIEIQVQENLMREEMQPLEKAKMLQYLLEKFPEDYPTHESLADRLKLDRTTVTKLLGLLRLPPELQRLTGTMDYDSVLRLRSLPEDERKKVVEAWEKRRLNQKQLRRLIETVRKGESVDSAIKKAFEKPTFRCARCSNFKPLKEWLEANLCENCLEKLRKKVSQLTM
jgi:ParB/RepB/Spo0J family partition protein